MAKTTVIMKEQLDAQLAFCDKIKSYWHARGATPCAYVETLEGVGYQLIEDGGILGR